MKYLGRVGARRVFEQGDLVGIAADQRIRRDPLERRAFLGVFIDSVLVERHRHRKLARRYQLADQRVALRKLICCSASRRQNSNPLSFPRALISAPNK